MQIAELQAQLQALRAAADEIHQNVSWIQLSSKGGGLELHSKNSSLFVHIMFGDPFMGYCPQGKAGSGQWPSQSFTASGYIWSLDNMK